jgi:hypothetical protein
MTPPETASTAVAWAPAPDRWIRDVVYDWTFFLGSTLLVFVVAQIFVAKGGGSNVLELSWGSEALNLAVPILLGGPHIFFSLVRTYMDVDFKRDHRVLLRASPHVIALSMMYCAFHGHTALLVNVVLYSAVFHGAAQLAHIGLRYRVKAGRAPFDVAGTAYLVATLAGPLYFVTYAVGSRPFTFVGQPIYAWLAPTWLLWASGAASLVGAAYWMADGITRRMAGGLFNWREGAILAATWGAFWFLANLDELDVTFQAYNAWHSVQAFGIMWLGMNAKWRAGKIRGPKQSRFCRDGAFFFTYGWALAFSIAIGVLVVLFSNFDFANLSASPFYFIFAVTVLLNHHFLDYWLFFGKRAFDY